MKFIEDPRIKVAKKTLALAWLYFTVFLVFIMGCSFLLGIKPFIWGLPAWVAIGNVVIPIVFVTVLILVIERFIPDIPLTDKEQQPGEEYFDPELLDPETGRIDTFKEFRKTIEKAGLEETVVAMVCRSNVASRQWATPLSLVFIDGGHSYETASMDYRSWAQHIIPHGYLLTII